MDLAFCLYSYFPFGGLQRNLFEIARLCVQRGHTVHAFARRWEGSPPDWMEIDLLPVRAISNVGRDKAFARRLKPFIDADRFDVVIGFNRLPGLDLFYAADPCLAWQYRKRRPHHRLTRRYRLRRNWEHRIFSPTAKTEILLVAAREKERFQATYGTPDCRFHVLPPNLDRDALLTNQNSEGRQTVRSEFGIPPGDRIVLTVGSGFRTKGVDRSIRAFSSLPSELRKQSRLLVVGRDRNSARYEHIAGQLGAGDRVHFTGGRQDVPDFYHAADLLIHPARTENTGTVLLEAMAMGLPVLTSQVCGYAGFVTEADAGTVLPETMTQQDLDDALLAALKNDTGRRDWSANGRRFAESTDLYSRYHKAADVIDDWLARNRA